MQHLVRPDRPADRRRRPRRRTPTGWASGRRSRSTCRPPSRRSPTATGSAAGRVRRRRRAGERRLRPGRDLRDAAPDGAGRVHRRQRRRADAAAPGHRDDRQRGGTRKIGPEQIGAVIDPADADAITRRRWSPRSRATLGRQFTTGAKVPGVTTAGKSGTAELGGTRRAALVVHRVRPGRATRRSRSPSSSSRAAGAARPRRRIAGDLMTRYLGGSTDDATPPERPGRTTRPTPPSDAGRRAAAARRADRPGGHRRRAWPLLFGGVAVAAWVGGEPFLAAMGGDRLPHDRRGSAS